MMNAGSFWGTFDLLLGREAQKYGGQDALKVGTWMSAYAGVRKIGHGDDSIGSGAFGSTGSDFTSLATSGSGAATSGGTGSLNFPSIYHQLAAAAAAGGNQLIGSDPNTGDGAGGPGGSGRADGGRGKGRKKLRLLKPKLKQLYDMEVLPVEYMGPKIEYTYV